MTTRRYALRDDQWERMKDLLPGRDGYVGATARDNRLFALGDAVSLSSRCPVARLAGAVWRFPCGAHSLQSLVKNRGVGACVSAVGSRCRQ